MFNVRRGHQKDSKFIESFQISMALETEKINLCQTKVEQGVATVLNEKIDGYYLVVEKEKEPVACTLVLSEWSDWRNQKVLWIHSVYVVPEFRGQGVFKKIYRHLQEEVENSVELAGLRLYVDKTNQAAQKVYKNLAMNAEHYDLYEWMK